MKNLNVEINSEELESCSNEMIEVNKRIEQIFNRVEKIISEVHNTDNWKGDTCEAYYSRFQELKEYFPKVNNGIENFARFLNVTSSNYTKAESTINKSIDTNKDKLDVNS